MYERNGYAKHFHQIGHYWLWKRLVLAHRQDLNVGSQAGYLVDLGRSS